MWIVVESIRDLAHCTIIMRADIPIFFVSRVSVRLTNSLPSMYAFCTICRTVVMFVRVQLFVNVAVFFLVGGCYAMLLWYAVSTIAPWVYEANCDSCKEGWLYKGWGAHKDERAYEDWGGGGGGCQNPESCRVPHEAGRGSTGLVQTGTLGCLADTLDCCMDLPEFCGELRRSMT